MSTDPRGILPAVILAGGRGTRMGGADKALLPLAGRPMIAHLIDRLAPQCAPLGINAGGEAGRFAFTDLPVLSDSVAGQPGPLAGILAALDWAAASGADAVVTAAVDTPFPPADLVDRLRQAARPTGLAIAASPDNTGRMRRHPTFGLWPVALREELRATLAAGQRRVVAFTEPRGCARAVFPQAVPDPFFNVNAPEDLAAADAFIAAASR